MTKEAVGRGEVVYARLGDSVVTGRFIQWLSRGGTYGDEEWRSWQWLLDEKPLTVKDENGEGYVLPTDNALLQRLEHGQLVEFEQVGATTWSARISTYYSHHLGSVRASYDVTIDTAASSARVVSLEHDVDLD